MRNLKFVRYRAVLLGLVVLRTKAQNGFCPMCTKKCHMVLTRSKPFWGQFWGQICETDSDSHQSNKCAALVSLRNADTYITGFTQMKIPTSQYISFTLQQEVVRKSLSHHPRALRRRSSCPAKYRPFPPPLWVSIHKAQLGTAQLFYGILLDGGKQQ